MAGERDPDGAGTHLYTLVEACAHLPEPVATAIAGTAVREADWQLAQLLASRCDLREPTLATLRTCGDEESATQAAAHEPGPDLSGMSTVQVRERLADAPAWELRVCVCSSDPAALAVLVDAVVAGLHLPWPVVDLLTSNPALPVPARRTLVAALVPRASGEEQLPDLVGRFPHDPVVVASWCAAVPRQVLTLHGWDPFGGPQMAVPVLQRAQEQWLSGAISYGQFMDLVRAAGRFGVDDHLVRALTPAAVEELICCGADGGSAASVYARLLEPVAADPTRWATFTCLVATFTGTLGELLTVCQALAVPAGS